MGTFMPLAGFGRLGPGDRAANVTDCRSVLRGFDSLPGHIIPEAGCGNRETEANQG